MYWSENGTLTDNWKFQLSNLQHVIIYKKQLNSLFALCNYNELICIVTHSQIPLSAMTYLCGDQKCAISVYASTQRVFAELCLNCIE